MQGKIKKIFSVVCLLAALGLSGCGGEKSDGGGGGPKVSLSPASATVSQGNTFTRTVEVLDVGGTFYVAFDLTYDHDVIEYVASTEGTFLSKNGSDETSFQIALDGGEQGRLTLGLTRLGPIGEVFGNGTLLSLTFRAVAPGTTTVAFTNPKGFKGMVHQEVPIQTWDGGTITVQ